MYWWLRCPLDLKTTAHLQCFLFPAYHHILAFSKGLKRLLKGETKGVLWAQLIFIKVFRVQLRKKAPKNVNSKVMYHTNQHSKIKQISAKMSKSKPTMSERKIEQQEKLWFALLIVIYTVLNRFYSNFGKFFPQKSLFAYKHILEIFGIYKSFQIRLGPTGARYKLLIMHSHRFSSLAIKCIPSRLPVKHRFQMMRNRSSNNTASLLYCLFLGISV